MARRRTNLSERIKAKRQATSRPPESAPPSEEPVLHVAPLPPPPLIEALGIEPAPPSEPPAPISEPAPPSSRVARDASPTAPPGSDRSAPPVAEDLAPISGVPGVPTPHHPWLLWVAGLAVVAGIGIGVKITRVRAAARAASKPPAALVKPAEPVAAPPAPAPPPPPPAPAETAAPSAVASAEPAPSASASAGEPSDGPSATTLRDHALSLLEQAKNPEAMAAARAAMAADPRDAMPYLVLGSALQDLGYWKQAHETYALCVKNAKKGMLDECRAMMRSR
jgi:hypothetical protein